MWRYLAGGVAVLLMIAAGLALYTGRAAPDPLPTPPAAIAGAEDPADPLPDRAPEASPKTREERRFGRYDKDRDGAIAREEYLASRRKAYAKLDVNGDGRLSFDEWAAKTIAKFATADADRSGAMSPREFATTAVKRTTKPRCVCPPAQASASDGDD